MTATPSSMEYCDLPYRMARSAMEPGAGVMPLRGKLLCSPLMGKESCVPKPPVRRTTVARSEGGSVQPAGSPLSSRSYRTDMRGRSRTTSASRRVTAA